MFNSESLKDDKHLRNLVAYMLHHDKYKVGRFVDIHTINQFIELLLNANLEEVKHLPKHNLYIYRTSDLGFAYSESISPSRLKELISLNKVDKDIPIHFEYKHGNVFTSIKLEDIDSKLLLTDDIYFIIKKETKEIFNMFIGKPTNPNYLYYRSNLDGKKTTINKLATLEYFNRINIHEKITNDFI